MDISTYINKLGHQAKAANSLVANTSVEERNGAIRSVAEVIQNQSQKILAANKEDLSKAKQNQLDAALLDRLTLTDKLIVSMASGLTEITKLSDPIGIVGSPKLRPSGIRIGHMRVPIGVIGIIYESRPNVTADAAGLCIKSGNVVILRGGSESFYSNQAIGQCISDGLRKASFPENAVQLISTSHRDAVGSLLRMDHYLDLIIPRGGKQLIHRVSKESQVPVLKHLEGICHVYVDKSADQKKALKIVDNSKTQRFGTCNTMETLLVHTDCADEFLPKIAKIFHEKNVELRVDKKGKAILPESLVASEKDWVTEYLGPILSIKIVDNASEAIKHINKFGSHHTDSIVTEDKNTADHFLKEVDSSSVMVNASTRFADGFEYGLGAEIGISTDKLHARGPVGLEGLTSLKWIVLGEGHIRQ